MLLPMETITNTTSASVPYIYRYEEPKNSDISQFSAAFSLQLRIYLLLRAFFFYVIRKQLVILPPSSCHPIEFSPSDENPLSPVPIEESVEVSSVISPQYAAMASTVSGIAVDESGIDLELQKAINAPSIHVTQQVEITRVNRFEFQKSGLFADIYRAAFLHRMVCRPKITQRCIWLLEDRSSRCWK